MRLSYAKSKSDVVAKADGTYVKREKRKRPESAPKAPLMALPPAEAQPPKQPKKAAANAPPSNVLFAQALPDDCTDTMLGILFQQYTGFKEVRMVPGKKGIAFVEFADDVQASLALAGLNNFKLTPTHTLELTFAKR